MAYTAGCGTGVSRFKSNKKTAFRLLNPVWVMAYLQARRCIDSIRGVCNNLDSANARSEEAHSI